MSPKAQSRAAAAATATSSGGLRRRWTVRSGGDVGDSAGGSQRTFPSTTGTADWVDDDGVGEPAGGLATCAHVVDWTSWLDGRWSSDRCTGGLSTRCPGGVSSSRSSTGEHGRASEAVRCPERRLSPRCHPVRGSGCTTGWISLSPAVERLTSSKQTPSLKETKRLADKQTPVLSE